MPNFILASSSQMTQKPQMGEKFIFIFTNLKQISNVFDYKSGQCTAVVLQDLRPQQREVTGLSLPPEMFVPRLPVQWPQDSRLGVVI